MLHTIKKAVYLEQYKIKLHFNNGKIKIVDLENLVKNGKNMFAPLADIDYFKNVTCDGITILWPNGVDLCPDVLYKLGKDFKQRSKSIRKKTAKKI